MRVPPLLRPQWWPVSSPPAFWDQSPAMSRTNLAPLAPNPEPLWCGHRRGEAATITTAVCYRVTRHTSGYTDRDALAPAQSGKIGSRKPLTERASSGNRATVSRRSTLSSNQKYDATRNLSTSTPLVATHAPTRCTHLDRKSVV